MQFMKKYVRKYWKFFVLAVLFLSVETLCDLMQPTIMSKIIDKGVKNKDLDYVINMGLTMIAVTGIGAIGAIMRNIISSNVSQKFGAELRSDLFKKIQSLSFENLNNFEGASLVTRLTNDVTQVQNFVNGLMRIFVKAPLLFIGSIIMASRLNYRMGIILICIVPLVSLLIYINMKVGYPHFRRVQAALDKVNSVMREYLSGVRVVKAFNRFDYETQRFEKSNDEFADESASAMRVMAIFSPNISLIVNFGIVFILYMGSHWVSVGSMKVGQIIAFTNYMTQILFSLLMISNVFVMFVRARASAERINQVFAQENTMTVKENAVKETEEKGAICFENVSFSYSKNSKEKVLKNISFSISKGETIGIIGSTGSGKSSLVNLIPRFYDALSGNVMVDGVNVKDMDINVLRNKIAVVPQKSILFTGTINDNIRWGKEDASEEEIIEACKTSQAHEFISSFPEKYQTMIGQGGVNFSGGQKQRAAIARALVKKPEILILDDSTSAVDVSTELKIRESLKEYIKNLTCIIIAQRITSVMTADRIIVLDNGKIVGIGNHDELMEKCDIYKDIFASQIGRGVAVNGTI